MLAQKQNLAVAEQKEDNRKIQKLNNELVKCYQKVANETFELFYAEKETEMKRILTTVYDALRQKGYNPINQIVGYILSEDPTYITTYQNARTKIRKVDRDDLLQSLVRSYLNQK